MKKKSRKVFQCSSCHAEFPRWAGRCDQCQAWNTIEEVDSGVGLAGMSGIGTLPEEMISLAGFQSVNQKRVATGVIDFDSVLGGGMVPGSLILIGGEPGVGKSTLILEVARNFPGRIFYFSGEESPSQIKLRSDRMGLPGDNIFLSRQSDIARICSTVLKEKPDLAVIDSIQTIGGGAGTSAGSVSMVREAAIALLEVAKSSSIPVLVTGHITREGSIAGPKMLEHMVDAVLYFESDRLNHYRLLRAVKNRFGPVGEVAIFEMLAGGLEPVSTVNLRPSERSAPGRVYSAIQEGSRSIGVEVQALVSRNPYSPARRMAEGLDNRRLILLAAVLEKYMKMQLSDCDIFANLAGGLNADEPALDLSLCAAILSSYREIPVPPGYAFIGEVGLSGEVRPVSSAQVRIKELTNLGFEKIYLPAANAAEINVPAICGLSSISELLEDL